MQDVLHGFVCLIFARLDITLFGMKRIARKLSTKRSQMHFR